MSAFESLELYFTKIKKYRVLPQHPLISVRFEEAYKTKIFMIFPKSFLNPSSNPSEIKGYWGRIKKNFYFGNVLSKKCRNWLFVGCRGGERAFPPPLKVTLIFCEWVKKMIPDIFKKIFENFLTHFEKIFFQILNFFSHCTVGINL